MRTFKILAVVALCVFGLSVSLYAAQNQFGVADTRQVTFDNPIKIGNVMLPKGDYEVRHTMKGEEHIMVFTQLKATKPVQAEVKCKLVPLEVKAPSTQKIYVLNAANERVLQELVFRGDKAKHVF